MAKVKEFPFGSLGVVRLLQELREELNLPFADIERFEEAERTLTEALKDMGQTAGRGAVKASAAEREAIRSAANNLGRAVRDAVEDLKASDLNRASRKQAASALRDALKRAAGDMKALSDTAHSVSSETASELSERVKKTVADLKTLSGSGAGSESGSDRP